jgi:hypothetical protein
MAGARRISECKEFRVNGGRTAAGEFVRVTHEPSKRSRQQAVARGTTSRILADLLARQIAEELRAEGVELSAELAGLV